MFGATKGSEQRTSGLKYPEESSENLIMSGQNMGNARSQQIFQQPARKPVKCPICGQKPVAKIVYRLIDFSGEDEIGQELKEGKIVLGGCCISSDDPTWECTKCGQVVYRKRGK